MSARYALLASLALLVSSLSVHAQCTNNSLYPGNAITPDPTGVITTITNCSYQTEYSRITGIVAGAGYTFTISDGTYITVRQGTFNGAVVAHGQSPLTITAPGAVDLFPHWTVNAACSTATACRVTTVQRLLNCTPAAVSVSAVNDCANAEFSLSVVVSNAGDASSLSFVYSVNGGGVTVQPGVVVGTYVLGPFASGALVDLTVAHGDDPLCNVVLNDLTNEPCIIESCGPDTYTFCYGNNENYTVTYQGNGQWPLRLRFNSGNVSPSGNDALVIHDGLNDTAPVLFSKLSNAGNLTGVTVTSTNPGHALTLRFTSNTSFSCGDGGVNPPWNYVVSCLSCTPASGEAGDVVTNCSSGTFTVPVTVTDLGSAPALSITNDAGVPATAVTATGAYVAGPFPIGTVVDLALVNVDDADCNTLLGPFEGQECPVQVVCGGAPVAATYCYTDSDARSWTYQNQGPEPIAIVFTQGVIESVTWDRLAIYDGTDNTAPLLWQHTQASNFNLAGLQVASTGQNLYMEMTSDASVSCGGGSFAPWIWSVSCLDCTNPQAGFTVVPDCAHNRYSVEVDVTDLGSADALNVTNNQNGTVIQGVGTGTTVVGPFPVGTAAIISLVNSANSLCRLNSPSLSLPLDSCVITACEPTDQSWCYANGDSVWFIYQSGVNAPITIAFSAGAVLSGDQILLYNGPDASSQLVYAGNAGGNVAGITLTSNNPGNALALVVVSNGAGSCATGEASPALAWSVGCGLVGVGEERGTQPHLHPNPAADRVWISLPDQAGDAALVEVVDAMGRVVRLDRAVPRPGGLLEVQLHQLAPGRYHVTVTTERGRWRMPLVVTR